MGTYVTHYSEIRVIGTIWMPSITAVYVYKLTARDIESLMDESGVIARAEVAQWLATNAGDFQSIKDFSADLWDGEKDVVFDWSDEESEITYLDCTEGARP